MRFWRVGIAPIDMFFHSFVASQALGSQLLKTGVAEDRLPKMSPICIMLWCESDLEAEIVKNWRCRSTF